MKKKVLSILLALALCLSLLPTAALAEDATAMPKYNGGNGTKDDPWLISSAADLQLLANTINDGDAAAFDADCTDTGDGIPGNYHGYYFKQTTDLDLSDIMNWDPIGYSGGQDLYFAGHYDGDGHTISNATCAGKNDDDGFATAGIFGWVAFGSVKNLTVKNADFFAEGNKNMSYAGGVLAVAYNCTVENCSVYDSKIESRRAPNENSNYAGGITGIALDSSFEKCASVKNTIRHGSFGGGFIGSVDGEGNSNFTNCYVANCTVTGCSDTGSNSTLSGGFLGAFMDGSAILNNCFVYDCAAQPDENTKGDDYFAVFAPNTQYGKIVVTSHVYYYDANDAKVNDEELENAVSKTVDEFANGTVAEALGTAFAQGKLYPVFATDPADYTAVDAAIAKANALNKDNYKDFSAVEAAVNAVDRNKKIAEQSEVDAMAKAIEDAIAALQYKDADYTKVDEAIAKANALNKDNYKDFSAVEAAVNAVVRNKKIAEQSEVDAMAKAIEDAIAALQYKDADYTAVDAAIEKASALKESDYKDFSAVKAALDAVVRGKNITEQSEVDAMAKAIEDAIAALVKKPSSGGGSSSGGSSSPSYPVTTPGKTENGTVTVSPRSAEKGDPVTITVKPDSGYQLDDLTVTDKNGREVKLTDKGNGKYTFTMPAGKVEISAAFVKEAEPSPFSDVSTTAYYYEAVKWAQEKGITGGIGNGLFGPNQPCTRGQIVTFLWRAAGSPVVNYAMNMTDVAEDAYYGEAVRWALSEGITTGTGDGKFSPDATCTRAQSVTFLFRAIGKLVDNKAEFSDVLTDSYYANAVAWAVENGVTNGIGDGLFGPDNSCTRAQIVTFLWRAYSK